jgi:hypothetical protein
MGVVVCVSTDLLLTMANVWQPTHVGNFSATQVAVIGNSIFATNNLRSNEIFKINRIIPSDKSAIPTWIDRALGCSQQHLIFSALHHDRSLPLTRVRIIECLTAGELSRQLTRTYDR